MMSQYPLRLPDHIMEQAKTAAAEDNVSVNQMFLSLISEGIGHRRALREVRARAARGNAQEAIAILDNLPGSPPEPDDVMPLPMPDDTSAVDNYALRLAFRAKRRRAARFDARKKAIAILNSLPSVTSEPDVITVQSPGNASTVNK